MRTHTALHVLCGVIWADYGIPVTGGNMEPLKGRLDFPFPPCPPTSGPPVEKRINDEIARRTRSSSTSCPARWPTPTRR